MSNKYFDGPSGVYYDRWNDRIVLLERDYSCKVYSKKAHRTINGGSYDFQASGVNLKNIFIVQTTHLVFVGEFE